MSHGLAADSTRQAVSNTTLVVATSAALMTLVPVAAHQLGLLAHLPDPPGPVFGFWGPVFASDKLTDSPAAHPLGVPDSLLGLVSYGATLGLAVAARRYRRARRPLGIKLLLDASAAGFQVARQFISFRRICSWCTGTAVCTGIMVFAGREFIAALRRV